jgi:hypothetical protein
MASAGESRVILHSAERLASRMKVVEPHQAFYALAKDGILRLG